MHMRINALKIKLKIRLLYTKNHSIYKYILMRDMRCYLINDYCYITVEYKLNDGTFFF